MHKIFKDYDGEIPTLDGFIDDSWQHDACPSLLNEEKEYKLWVDYVDPDRRECGGARYTLCAYDESEDQYLYLFSSDSLSTIEEFLK